MTRLSWRARWIVASVLTATLATLADAALLQRARSYFTGGFLAADAIGGPSDAVGFFFGSLVADLGVSSLLVALVLWMAAKAGLRVWVAMFLAVGLALLPIAVADFASYELASYLGDAFDFTLMFDLAGRSPAEIFAVASAHLSTIAWLGGIAVAGVIALVWFIRRSRGAVA